MANNNLNIIGSAGVNGNIPIGDTAAGYATWATVTPGTGISVTNGAHSITLSSSATTPLSFPTDAGTAIPALNALTVAGAHNINTSGAGSTVTVQNNNTATFGDLAAVAAGSPSMTLTTGDLLISSGSINLPSTSSTTTGYLNINSVRWLHQAGNVRNTFVGSGSGNATLTSLAHTGVGNGALAALTAAGNSNTAVGDSSGAAITSGSGNTSVGQASLQGITTGANNVAIGHLAGNALTLADSNNILIKNTGVAGDSAAIKIGTGGTQTTAFIAGTYGVTPAGATQVMVMDNAGQMGTSATPPSPASATAFNAYYTASAANVTGAGVTYQLVPDTERFDLGNNFNTGTGTYTAPSTGYYMFGGTLALADIDAPHATFNVIVLAGGVAYDVVYSNAFLTAGTDGILMRSWSIVVPLTAAQTFICATTVFGGTQVVDVVGTTLLVNVGTTLWGYRIA